MDVPDWRPFAGVVYLAIPPSAGAEAACECSVGVALLPFARGNGVGSYAVRHAISLAFGTLAFHRVSASVLGPSPLFDSLLIGDGKGKQKATEGLTNSTILSERALRFFIGLGFSHEGTRRRAVPGNLTSSANGDGTWRDASSLAMLDTEWVYIEERADLRRNKRPMNVTFSSAASNATSDSGLSTVTEKSTGRKYVRRTRWDEMLARQQREQEVLVAAEGRLKRTASTETIKPNAGDVVMDAPGSLAPESSTAHHESSLDESGTGHWVEPDSWLERAECESDSITEASQLGISAEASQSQSRLIPTSGVARPHERIEEYLHAMDPSRFTPGPPSSDVCESHSDAESFSELGDSVSVARDGEVDSEMGDNIYDDGESEAVPVEPLRFIPRNVSLRSVNAVSRPSVSSQSDFSSSASADVIDPFGDASAVERSGDASSSEVSDHDMDEEHSDVHSDSQTSSGSEWEQLSNPASPPRSVATVSSASSWTNASVSEADRD